MLPVDTSNPAGIKKETSGSFRAKSGQEVSFKQLPSGQWEAEVKECLPAGFSRKLLLPVFLEPGQSINKLSGYSSLRQKNHIHIVLGKAKNYIFIGRIGLLGGGYGEKNVSNPNMSDEFTSEKGLTYEVLKNITLEIAQEVEEQTGLVIPFAPGETSTEFIGGRGNFGELRLGKEQISGKYYGLKIMSINTGDTQEVETAQSEIELQRKLTGLPHLMPLVDIGETSEEYSSMAVLYQVMPLASLGNGAQLATYLQTVTDKSFKEAILIHVAKSILQVFVAMHGLEEPIAHLDFKPDNLVIDKQGEVSIIDFGCSASLDEKGLIEGRGKGDFDYFSPERYESSAGNSSSFPAKPADSWAIGLSLLELASGIIDSKEGNLTGNPDWYFLSDPYLQEAAAGSYGCVVKGLLNPDPSKRLSPEEALAMDIFQTETSPAVLSFLKEFVQTLQWNKRKEKMGQETHGLTSAQQLGEHPKVGWILSNNSPGLCPGVCGGDHILQI
jgi:serine/threonine protein kinase